MGFLLVSCDETPQTPLNFESCCMRRNCTNFVKHSLQCTLDYLDLLVDSANNIHEDVLLVCSGDVGAYLEGLATIYLEMHHSGPTWEM